MRRYQADPSAMWRVLGQYRPLSKAVANFQLRIKNGEIEEMQAFIA